MEVREPSPRYALSNPKVSARAHPDDWAVVAVQDAGEVLGGRQRSPSAQGEMTRYLRVANVFLGRIETNDVRQMPFTADERVRFGLKVGDILLNEGQSLELVGRSAIYEGDPPDCCFQNTLVRFRARAGTDPRYAQSLFESYLRRGEFAKIALQTTSIAHLGAGRFARMEFVAPPYDEQVAIGAALADADALIDSLEQLLTKKRQIKQGAMQELLTGKRRLPGFSRAWTYRGLAELADIRSGGTPSTRQPEFWNGSLPWCTPTDITALAGSKYVTSTERSISDKGLRAISDEALPVGTVVMTSRATIGECAIATVPLATNQGFKNFVPNSETSGEFLYYLLRTQKQALLALCSGSTFLEIGKRQLADFTVFCPVERDEQTAIAQVLSDVDAEISALESRLTKARALKQAMAQALLTGRIRLVEPIA